MKVDDDVSRTKYALTTQQIKGNEEIPGTKKKKINYQKRHVKCNVKQALLSYFFSASVAYNFKQVIRAMSVRVTGEHFQRISKSSFIVRFILLLFSLISL